VSLALSLHAPDQELRRTIVPSARAYPLERLMAAVGDYQAASGQRVFVEYVMLAGGWQV
jgi:adenine C2-methylase RlmN of 23S rRNA A2503 and tRNA A37